MPTSRDFDHGGEPNWLFVQNKSDLVYNDIDHIFVAFMDRYAYKAPDSICDIWDEDFDNALSEGYLLYGVTEQDYQDMVDPYYGTDPVFQGPYYVDQNDHGHFDFHGPLVKLQGPRPHWDWKPADWPDQFYWDRTLSYDEVNGPTHFTKA